MAKPLCAPTRWATSATADARLMVSPQVWRAVLLSAPAEMAPALCDVVSCENMPYWLKVLSVLR